MKTGCAILAGGSATRFGGRFKPAIEIDGRRVIDRILDVVLPLFSEIIIVTNRQNLFDQNSNIIITSDIFASKGPLSGLHAALKISHCDALFVVAGDMPFLDKRVIENLCNEFNTLRPQALVPRHTGLIEPLHSVYSIEITSLLEKVLNESDNTSVKDFLNQIDTRYLEVELSVAEKAFININSGEDLRLL
jgi:molybdopterin-guanine dinucleotide biosynthesis protein A